MRHSKASKAEARGFIPSYDINTKLGSKTISRDHPAGCIMSTKGKAPHDTSKFEPPGTRTMGKRWGSGNGPRYATPQVWGFKLPSGRVIEATTKPKGKAGAGWYRLK